MSVPLFFHNAADDGRQVTLDEANSRHALQVLRMQPGDTLELTNGAGLLWQGVIAEAGKKKCSVTIRHQQKVARLQQRRTAIAISPVKNMSRFEWFLEKATELGVHEIFPLLCHRTERSHMRHDRLQQICISAMLQSRQAWLPVLHEPLSFASLLAGPGQAYRHRWIAHCLPDEKIMLANALQPDMPDSLLLIGPEGDFTPEEILNATQGGFRPVALGHTRLRTETAGVAGATLLCML